MASWSAVAQKVRVPLGFAFAVLYLWLAKPNSASLLAGSCFVVLGLLVRALASGHVTKNERLTTSGPYAYTRNPLYLGSIILAAGFVLASRSWWIAGMAVLFFVVIYVPVIRAEEAFLRLRFPEFDDYALRVPRLVPRLGPAVHGEGAFSWELYRKHHEYHALLGAAAIVMALVLKGLLWPR